MRGPPGEVAPAARSATQIRAWLVAELARALRTGERSIDTSAPLHETGADSVTAFRLTGALADWLQRDLPVTLAWDYESIDALATALAGEGLNVNLPPGVVALQPRGERRPLFCFPGIGGHPVTFAPLAAHLAPDVPCYGLTTPGFDGAHPPLRSVERIADQLLEAVRAIQPRGPYQLAGYSFGGLLAYEAAQQLSARGDAVSLVAIYDTFTPAGLVARPLWERLALHGWFLATRSDRAQYLRRHLQLRRAKQLRQSLLAEPPHDAQVPERVAAAVKAANEEASHDYEPRAYGGRLVVFQAARRAIESRFFLMDSESNGWHALTSRRAEIVRVDACHDDMLAATHGEAMADCLRPFLQ